MDERPGTFPSFFLSGPDDADPIAPDFADRFARYCRGSAEYVTRRVRGAHCFTRSR